MIEDGMDNDLVGDEELATGRVAYRVNRELWIEYHQERQSITKELGRALTDEELKDLKESIFGVNDEPSRIAIEGNYGRHGDDEEDLIEGVRKQDRGPTARRFDVK